VRNRPPNERRRRLQIWGAGMALAVAVAIWPVTLLAFPASSESDPEPPMLRLHGIRNASRVAVVMLENRDYRQVIGNRSAPYINRLAGRYTLATHYYAIGHPSLPNYLALLAGDTFGVQDDCGGCSFEAPTLVNQLSAAGIPWRAYYQSLPGDGPLTTVNDVYTGSYNPFAHLRSVNVDAERGRRIVSFGSLSRDLARRRLPRLAWITPDKLRDGHSSSLREADRYVSRLIPRVIRALGPKGLLYLTWDEGPNSDQAGLDGGSGGGQVPLIVAGGGARRHARMSTEANHYALLRTIETHFGLPLLGRAGSPSTPLLHGGVKGR
jgi:hypothetical protein